VTSVSWVHPGVWAAALLLAVVVLLLFPIPFRFTFSYRGAEAGEEAVFEFSLFGGRWVRRQVIPLPEIGPGPAGGTGRADLSAFVGKAADIAHRLVGREERLTPGRPFCGATVEPDTYARPVLALARMAWWTRLSWRTVLDLGDAARTGLGAGLLWAVKGTLAAAARQVLRLSAGQPEFLVTPDFEGDGTLSVIEGRGVLRVGQLLLVAPMLVRSVLGHRRSGRRSATPRNESRTAGARSGRHPGG